MNSEENKSLENENQNNNASANSAEQPQGTTQTGTAKKKSNENSFWNRLKKRFVKFIKNNKAATILFLILVVVFIWFSIKQRITESNFKKEKTELITQYESRIDSLQIEYLQFAAEVFSWSVRSELLRDNTENLNQLLSVFVRKSGADLVQLINPKDNIILLSSDKKYEGEKNKSGTYSNLTSTTVYQEPNKVKIVCPVMGYNEKIGILVVELNK